MRIRGMRGRIKRYIRGLKHCHNVVTSVDDKQHIYYFGVPMHPNLVPNKTIWEQIRKMIRN